MWRLKTVLIQIFSFPVTKSWRPTIRALAMPSHLAGLSWSLLASACQCEYVCWATLQCEPVCWAITKNFENAEYGGQSSLYKQPFTPAVIYGSLILEHCITWVNVKFLINFSCQNHYLFHSCLKVFIGHNFNNFCKMLIPCWRSIKKLIFHFIR